VSKRDARTKEELEECAALKSAVEELNLTLPKELRFTQEGIAKKFGMIQGSISSYFNGLNSINLEFAIRISALTGIPISNFSQRLHDLYSSVSHLDSLRPVRGLIDEVQCDHYQSTFSPNDNPGFVVSRSSEVFTFLKSDLIAAGVEGRDIGCLTITDDSLHPNILRGSKVAFNRSGTELSDLTDGALYVLEVGGLLQVRRLYRTSNSVMIKAFNTVDFKDEAVSFSDIGAAVQILGKVFWWSTFIT
jgi:transcriptional regulator with XRE-family HTH domain